MELPRLILIADRFTQEAVASLVLKAVAAGVPWVHLRDHAAEDEEFERGAAALVDHLRQLNLDVLISVNGRRDVAERLGVHYHGGAGRSEGVSDRLNGYSAHKLAEGYAMQQEVDYFFFSPIFPTTSKPGHAGTGLEALVQFCASVSQPVYALGGIQPANVKECLEAGAHGVAVISGILAANLIEQAVDDYLEVLS